MPIQLSSLPSSSITYSTATFGDSWSNNVFLSFGGEDDVCKSFVDHLFSTLKQKGIHIYMRGELVGSSFTKAIEESQVAIIVFSKNCISCSFLDEVAHIMKCMDERGQVVKAVFYGMDDLMQMREEIQNYGEAISKLELINDRKIGSWRNAMMHASNLSGWVPNYFANGLDSRFINQIVNTISLGLLPLLSSSHTVPVGVESRMFQLKSLLEIGADDVRMVGIWGIGGGGKSALAFSIYKEICHEFDRCCFVANIREESREHGLEKMQQKLFNTILKPKQVVVEGSTEEGKGMIKSRLCSSSVLIVLDDVGDTDQLNALAGSHEWFGKGSRIIITTRNKGLLNAHVVDATYEMSLLNDKEAIELFSRNAFGKNTIVEGYEELSQKVVSRVGGHPLALKSLGSFLCNKDINEWTSTLASSIPYNQMFENLKTSYDELEHEEKELFLEIACLLAAGLGHSALTILDACGFDYVKGVDVLIRKALITVSDGVITMHDMVKEMGLDIFQREHPNNPEHSRVWQKEDILNICAMNQTKVVSNMKVQWICCPDYPADMLPTDFQPPELCCLLLEASLQKQLWEGYKHLPMLKVLSVIRSRNIICTPDVSGLSCLERMTFRDCDSLQEIHPSIGYHERVVLLKIQNCTKLQTFPPIVRMKNLETLILTHCYFLAKVPEIQTKLDRLVKLSLRTTGIKFLPSSIGKYCTSLVSLEVSFCRNLKSIEGNFHSLKSLKELHLTCCGQLGKLPNDLFDVESCCVETLSLSSRKSNLVTGIMSRLSLTALVSSKFPRFPCLLKKLDLRMCNLVDGDIPSDICSLSNLEELDLCGNEFTQLHSVLTPLPRLKFLDLSYCNLLINLPLLPSSIAFLKADCCDALEIQQDLPSDYKWLWKVSLDRRPHKLIGCDRVLRSMLQGKAIQDHFMSLRLQHSFSKKDTSMLRWNPLTLQLPRNWYNDFSGFLICVTKFADYSPKRIIIKQDTSAGSQSADQWEKYDNTFEYGNYPMVGYVSFASLRHTSWWSSAHTKISILVQTARFKVALVPRKSEGSSREQVRGNCSEYWDRRDDGKGDNTFEIQHDLKSSIQISWAH